MPLRRDTDQPVSRRPSNSLFRLVVDQLCRPAAVMDASICCGQGKINGCDSTAAPSFLTILISVATPPLVGDRMRLPGRFVKRSRSRGSLAAPGPIATRCCSPPRHLPRLVCPPVGQPITSSKAESGFSRARFFFTTGNH